jgi:hypothetical protein
LLLSALVISSPSALADPPVREGPLSFPFTIDDFFAGSGQSCDFPVVGTWDVTLSQTTYFYPGTPQAARIVTDVDFSGALSNALTGKSVPDASHHDEVADYYAPDGTYLKTVENESRDDSLLHAAFHAVTDSDGDVTLDAGRDWFKTRALDAGPVCRALS